MDLVNFQQSAIRLLAVLFSLTNYRGVSTRAQSGFPRGVVDIKAECSAKNSPNSSRKSLKQDKDT